MWAKRAAQQGDAHGMTILAELYAPGLGVLKDTAKARYYFELAIAKHEPPAIGGDPQAQLALGGVYAIVPPGLRNYGEAIKWYLKAANQNFAEAKYRVGLMYMDGRGVTKNVEEAISWSQQAAEQGYLEAAHSLGSLYEDDFYITRNEDETTKWYLYAAERGHSRSQVRLGAIYGLRYLEHPQQHDSSVLLQHALHWLRKAVEQGDGYVIDVLWQHAIVFRSDPDKGEPVDESKQEFVSKLVSLMKMLAEAGNENAQVLLGPYYHGKIEGIVSKDSQEALFWLSKAAERGNREAIELIDEIDAE